MAEFLLTPAAMGDLERLWRYTETQWGRTQAEKYLDVLNAAFAALANDTGMACDHIRAGYRRVYVQRHAIYYKMHGDTAIVVRVLHQQMDAVKHLYADPPAGF